MKVLGYIPLHYGREFLSEAIKSIHNHVDKIIILYVEDPSFGKGTPLECPDKKEDLKAQAMNTSDKCVWIDTQANNEGEHTGQIFQYADDYDLILRIDADEVYDQSDLAEALIEAHKTQARYFGVIGYLNFYRSFNTVCIDHFTPIRIIKPHFNDNITHTVFITTYHFSLCQSDAMMRYKWSGLHGHQDELRPGWLEEKYFGYKEGMTDLHPVAIGLWNPESFNKELMPAILKAHPYYNLDQVS